MDSMIDEEECTTWIKVKDVHSIIASMPQYKKILFSDKKTKLLNFISAVEKPKTFLRFLYDIADVNVCLPNNSPLWPGSTLLHLAVMFSENLTNEDKAAHLVNQCLNQGALVQVQNQRGETPLHLAFRLKQQQIMALLMRILEKQAETVENLLDVDNLSYLHIACTVNDHRKSLARKLLSNERSIGATINVAYKGKSLANVKPGWTPLHVAVDQRQHSLTESLLRRGASTVCTDARGSSAIHQLFDTTGTKPLACVLFASEQLRDCVQVGTGLTHLHVAVWFNDVKSAERLLDVGADIEATVNTLEGKDVQKFGGCTALHMAMIMDHFEMVKMLMKRGANVLAVKSDGTSPLSEALTVKNKSTEAFVPLLWSDGNLQKRLEEELGLTMLHFACYNNDIDKVDFLIHKGANVNAKMSGNSNFWRGYTPLHVLIGTCTWYRQSTRTSIFMKLWQNGCDIDQQDCSGKTALHLATGMDTFISGEFIRVLLSAGADINIVDCGGKSVISYALEYYLNSRHAYERIARHGVVSMLTEVVHMMKMIGIEVSEFTRRVVFTVLAKFKAGNIKMPNFIDEIVVYNQLQDTEKIIIGPRGLTLRSFLFETGAISIYPSLTPDDRVKIAEFFQSLNDQQSTVEKLRFLLNLQYRKAVARLSLVSPAADALKDFISPSFPDLCIDVILKYLSNSDLKQLTAASMIVD